MLRAEDRGTEVHSMKEQFMTCSVCQNAIKLRKYISKSSVPEIAQKQPAGAFEPLSTEQKTKLGAGDNLLER